MHLILKVKVIMTWKETTVAENPTLLSVFIYFPVYGYVICDHMRALHVYMSALKGSCPLTGFPCSSYENFLAGQCTSCDGLNGLNNVCPQIGKRSLLLVTNLIIHYNRISADSLKGFNNYMIFITLKKDNI